MLCERKAIGVIDDSLALAWSIAVIANVAAGSIAAARVGGFSLRHVSGFLKDERIWPGVPVAALLYAGAQAGLPLQAP